jgi:hypothetical protein
MHGGKELGVSVHPTQAAEIEVKRKANATRTPGA